MIVFNYHLNFELYMGYHLWRQSREWLEGYEPSPCLKHLIRRWLEPASGFVKGYIGRYVVPLMEELEP
jgi:hypothetical protein